MLGMWLGGEEQAKKQDAAVRIVVMRRLDGACCQCLGTSFLVLWLYPCTDDCG